MSVWDDSWGYHSGWFSAETPRAATGMMVQTTTQAPHATLTSRGGLLTTTRTTEEVAGMTPAYPDPLALDPRLEVGSTSDPTSVYLYYDKASILLYVGVTRRGTVRNREHDGKAWWPFVCRQAVEHFPSRATALAREKELILRHRPPYNKQHNPFHEEIREAYELARSGGLAVDSAETILRLEGNRIPMRCVGQQTPDAILLSTLPKHAPIAKRLVFARDIMVVGPKKMGEVTRTERAGGLAMVEFRPRTAFRVQAAAALIKFIGSAPARDLRIHRIELATVTIPGGEG